MDVSDGSLSYSDNDGMEIEMEVTTVPDVPESLNVDYGQYDGSEDNFEERDKNLLVSVAIVLMVIEKNISSVAIDAVLSTLKVTTSVLCFLRRPIEIDFVSFNGICPFQ